MKTVLRLATLLAALLAVPSHAQVPLTVGYQGYLADAKGQPPTP